MTNETQLTTPNNRRHRHDSMLDIVLQTNRSQPTIEFQIRENNNVSINNDIPSTESHESINFNIDVINNRQPTIRFQNNETLNDVSNISGHDRLLDINEYQMHYNETNSELMNYIDIRNNLNNDFRSSISHNDEIMYNNMRGKNKKSMKGRNPITLINKRLKKQAMKLYNKN